jgi:hypothetical protein
MIKLDFVSVIEGRNLLESSVLMSEEASLSIWAEEFFSKCCTDLRLILGISWVGFANHLEVSVGKLAFVSVSAGTNFDPILTHFSLVFGLVCFEVSGVQIILLCCFRLSHA